MFFNLNAIVVVSVKILKVIRSIISVYYIHVTGTFQMQCMRVFVYINSISSFQKCFFISNAIFVVYIKILKVIRSIITIFYIHVTGTFQMQCMRVLVYLNSFPSHRNYRNVFQIEYNYCRFY